MNDQALLNPDAGAAPPLSLAELLRRDGVDDHRHVAAVGRRAYALLAERADARTAGPEAQFGGRASASWRTFPIGDEAAVGFVRRHAEAFANRLRWACRVLQFAIRSYGGEGHAHPLTAPSLAALRFFLETDAQGPDVKAFLEAVVGGAEPQREQRTKLYKQIRAAWERYAAARNDWRLPRAPAGLDVVIVRWILACWNEEAHTTPTAKAPPAPSDPQPSPPYFAPTNKTTDGRPGGWAPGLCRAFTCTPQYREARESLRNALRRQDCRRLLDRPLETQSLEEIATFFLAAPGVTFVLLGRDAEDNRLEAFGPNLTAAATLAEDVLGLDMFGDGGYVAQRAGNRLPSHEAAGLGMVVHDEVLQRAVELSRRESPFVLLWRVAGVGCLGEFASKHYLEPGNCKTSRLLRRTVKEFLRTRLRRTKRGRIPRWRGEASPAI